jgi:formamidopyrimidine-DNA glycosylase
MEWTVHEGCRFRLDRGGATRRTSPMIIASTALLGRSLGGVLYNPGAYRKDKIMPELPEVETTRRGLLPATAGRRVSRVVVRERRLRWPVPAGLSRTLSGQTLRDIERRGKYLLWQFDTGFLLTHLGMSGSLTALQPAGAPAKHDHIDIVFENGVTVRYADPRRFGAMLWIAGRTPNHSLLDSLGPEPLARGFDGQCLHAASRGKSLAVKNFIMDSRVVVGVGNIYASESLFHAGIHPATAAGRVSLARYERLAQAIKSTLRQAIRAGGSSLRNYVAADGSPGYFQLAAMCYDREGEPCRVCGKAIRRIVQGQRATFFCPACQN